MNIEGDKVICEVFRCKWKGRTNEILHAENPFDSTDKITGCPNCKSIDTGLIVCDEPDCWKPATCGFPIGDIYRSTCGEHYKPEIKEAK